MTASSGDFDDEWGGFLGKAAICSIDPGRFPHPISFPGFSPIRSVGQVGENPGNEVVPHLLSRAPADCRREREADSNLELCGPYL